MILNFYGLKKSEKEIAKLIGATRKNGCTPEQILIGVEKLGFNSYYKKNSNVNELKDLLDKNIPVIIYWTKNKEGHYSVVCGIENDKILVADPRMKKKIFLGSKDFLERWKDLDSKDKKEIIVILRN
jgi:predicted double-glycine peptidase